jgi:hypothetical protein
MLMNDRWEALFPLTNLRKIPSFLSDHNPLLLCTEQERIKNSKQFFFETAWLKHADFIPKIKEIWEKTVSVENAVKKWYIKLNRVKKFLK